MKPSLLILAAGMGSRYGGLKQMDSFGPSGETIIDYSIFDAIRAGFGKVVFVIRKDIEEDFKQVFLDKYKDKIEVDYCIQALDMLPNGISLPPARKKPWGTAHAVLVAKDKINAPFAVINGDDFYGREAFSLIHGYLSKMDQKSLDAVIVGYKLKNTLSDNGDVNRGVCVTDENSNLVRINERTGIERKFASKQIVYTEDDKLYSLGEETIVSMNLMGFSPAIFDYMETKFVEFLKARKDEPKSEFFLPLVLDSQINELKKNIAVLPTDSKWFGVTYANDKESTVESINNLVNKNVYPNNLWNNLTASI